MGVRSMTVRRFEEIRRRLGEGRGLREIARALGCSRDTVREVRDGLRVSPDAPKALPDPLWMLQVDWPPLIHDLGLGHPLKFLWEERAQHLTTYSNFWKQFYRKFPQYRQASVTAREFTAGERVEVDYAGDPIEWFDLKTGEIHQAWVFVAVLGFSQLLYARGAEDMQSRNWLGCHRRHLYDPDLNPAYAALGVHFSTAIVPARPGHPKDKALVENGVKLLMRYQRFRYRRTRLTSLAQVNQALEECAQRINDRRHTRFGVSRRERFETVEKATLKPLPIGDLEYGDWKDATLHPDCYVYIEGDYYSAPHIHRHKKLRIKITENQVEIFLNLERLAIHPRSRHKEGRRIKIEEHFPPNSVAYYESTPQKLLSQSRFIHPDLNALFVELFNADVYGHLRRAQGFVRTCTKEINTAGHEAASVRIAAAIATMRRYNRYRVPYLHDLLVQARKQLPSPASDREIVRRPGNPMLRYVGGAVQAADADAAVPTVNQESLEL
jgi:hypothetical protein